MFRASVTDDELIGKTEYRLTIFKDRDQGLRVYGKMFDGRFDAACYQADKCLGKLKSLINPVTTIVFRTDVEDIEIEDYNEEIDTVCDDFIVQSSYYRGFRIDIDNRNNIYILYKNSDGIFTRWKMIDGRIRNNPRNYYVDDALDFIDYYLLEKHKDWCTVYVIYSSGGYHGDDRRYLDAYTSLDEAKKAKSSYTIEEIEVPFIDDRLYYVDFDKDTKGIFVGISEYYVEISDLYSSPELAKDDDIWKRMMKLAEDNPDSKFHISDTAIATDADGEPFSCKFKNSFYGSCAVIRSIPIIKV